MSAAPKAAGSGVSPEEMERRLAEYRAQGFEHRTMPHIVYHDPYIVCPWPGCGYRIAGIDFQLEKLYDPARYAAVGRVVAGSGPRRPRAVRLVRDDRQTVGSGSGGLGPGRVARRLVPARLCDLRIPETSRRGAEHAERSRLAFSLCVLCAKLFCASC